MTLIELLNVAILISILATMALPTYMSVRDKAYRTAAIADVNDFVLTAKFYAEDNFPGSARDPDPAAPNDSGFAGMTASALRSYDPSLWLASYVNNSGTEAAGVTARAPLDATHFCVYSVVSRWFAYQRDLGGAIQTTIDPAAVCT